LNLRYQGQPWRVLAAATGAKFRAGHGATLGIENGNGVAQGSVTFAGGTIDPVFAVARLRTARGVYYVAFRPAVSGSRGSAKLTLRAVRPQATAVIRRPGRDRTDNGARRARLPLNKASGQLPAAKLAESGTYPVLIAPSFTGDTGKVRVLVSRASRAVGRHDPRGPRARVRHAGVQQAPRGRRAGEDPDEAIQGQPRLAPTATQVPSSANAGPHDMLSCVHAYRPSRAFPGNAPDVTASGQRVKRRRNAFSFNV